MLTGVEVAAHGSGRLTDDVVGTGVPSIVVGVAVTGGFSLVTLNQGEILYCQSFRLLGSPKVRRARQRMRYSPAGISPPWANLFDGVAYTPPPLRG